MHALRPAGQDRIVGAFAEQAVCFPGDVALACASMITGGIASRHPKLRIAFSHGGGTMSILMPRLVHAWNMFPKAKESLPESPATIAKRFYYDELVFEPNAVSFLVETFGETQILVGTDYPFALGRHEPDEDAREAPSLGQRHADRDYVHEREALPRIAGRTSLIEPGSTASATSSNGRRLRVDDDHLRARRARDVHRARHRVDLQRAADGDEHVGLARHPHRAVDHLRHELLAEGDGVALEDAAAVAARAGPPRPRARGRAPSASARACRSPST